MLNIKCFIINIIIIIAVFTITIVIIIIWEKPSAQFLDLSVPDRAFPNGYNLDTDFEMCLA